MNLDANNVAVIIPVYARSDRDLIWLDKCIASCESQVGEIVVWNDGSEIQVSDVVSRHNAVLKSHRHVGKSYARNSAVETCTKEFILPVDADDWLEANAVSSMLNVWKGIPVYTDIVRIVGGARKHCPMPSFDCSQLTEKCIAAVNVLHLKSQWKEVGGWNTAYNLLEDWEYNSRLFAKFCGFRLDSCVYNYRIHDGQSTSTSSMLLQANARYQVVSSIKSYMENLKMGCCPKKRTPAAEARTLQAAPVSLASMSSSSSVDLSAEILSMSVLGDPGPGKVWAIYVGGRGMGPHDKRGHASRNKYKRVKYGGTYAVASADAVSKDAFEHGSRNCGLIQITEMRSDPSPPPTPVPISAATSVRTPVEKVRTPVISDADKLSDDVIAAMSVRELMSSVKSLTHEQIIAYLESERNCERPRVTIVKILEKALNALTS